MRQSTTMHTHCVRIFSVERITGRMDASNANGRTDGRHVAAVHAAMDGCNKEGRISIHPGIRATFLGWVDGYREPFTNTYLA